MLTHATRYVYIRPLSASQQNSTATSTHADSVNIAIASILNQLSIELRKPIYGVDITAREPDVSTLTHIAFIGAKYITNIGCINVYMYLV